MIILHRQEEIDLVKACCRGDSAAQEELYKRYSRKMFGVCLGYANDFDSAKDLLQEGFIKVFQKLSKYDGNGSLEGWIRRIVVNNNIDHYRKKSREASYVTFEEEQLTTEENSPVISNEAFKKLQVDEFLRMTQSLPEGYRMILNLHLVEGFTHKEIGEHLGISEGTSKSQFSKAKRHLSKSLHHYFDAEILSSYEKRSS